MMKSDKSETQRDDSRKPAKDNLKRQGNEVDGEEQVPSGLRPDLEPPGKKNKGHGGDGGGVGSSL